MMMNNGEKGGQTKKDWAVSEEEAIQWIKLHNQDINPNEWRQRMYEKYGIKKKEEEEEREGRLEKQDQFQNDKYYISFFSQRTSNHIRNRYLSRLQIDESESQPPPKKSQHIFIFDWDDTILCTTYLSSFQFIDIGPENKALLTRLDDSSQRLLSRALLKGQKIYIITNAAKGWVEYSSKVYLPQTHQVFSSSQVQVISARSMFGEEFPGDFYRWKVEAFKTILKTANRNLVTNLICIGDSNIEMEAAHSLSKEFEHSLVKTIKFRENPKPEQLIKQQELVFERMKQIFQSTKNLTIRLERKSKEKRSIS